MIEKNQTRRNILRNTTAIATGTTLISTLTDSVNAAHDSAKPDDEEIKQEINNNPYLEYIEANPDKGFHYPYLLYTPSSFNTSEESPRPILIQGNNSHPDDDFTTHLYRAKDIATQGGGSNELADGIGIPLLLPVFPRYREEPEPWWVYVQTLDPDTFKLENSPLERVDLQLLEMVDDAKSRLESDGHTIASEVHIDGFSGSGTFANRFTILHPERVNAASHGGTTAKTLPKTEIDDHIPVVGDPKWDEMSYPVGTDKEELPYPIGVANLEELTGSPFNEEAWLNTPQYIYIGKEDRPESGSRGHRSFSNLYDEEAQQIRASERSYAMPDLIDDIYGVKNIDERWNVSRAVYENVGAAATFTVYEGYGHTPRPAIDDLVDFHRNEIQNTYGSNSVSEDSSSGDGEESTAGETTDDESSEDENGSNGTSEESPGFGVGATLSGIAGAGYIFKRLLESEP